VTISVADIDLLVLDLRLLLTSIETSMRRGIERSMHELTTGPALSNPRGQTTS
jgi:hypothetical protein